MADNVFGLDVEPKVDDELYEDEPAAEAAEVEEAPAQEEAGDTPEADAPDAPSVEAPPPPLDEVEEPPSEPVDDQVAPEGTPVPETWAQDRNLSKFKTVEALVDSYNNAIALHSRGAERTREAERQMQGWKETAEQALQMLQSRQATAVGPSAAPTQLDPDIAALAKETGIDEDTLRVAQAIAARQTQQATQSMQEQQLQRDMAARQQQARQALETSVAGFFTAHPEVTQGSPQDMKMGEVVTYFNLDPSQPDALEAAYAVAQDPELERYVRANPHLIDTDEGMDYAREQLALNKRLSVAASAHTAAQDESARQAALRKASVETGSGGTPPTSPGGENDEWAQVLAVARKDRGAEDVFGLGS